MDYICTLTCEDLTALVLLSLNEKINEEEHTEKSNLAWLDLRENCTP